MALTFPYRAEMASVQGSAEFWDAVSQMEYMDERDMFRVQITTNNIVDGTGRPLQISTIIQARNLFTWILGTIAAYNSLRVAVTVVDLSIWKPGE